jgi:hypothetical protein
LTVQRSAAPISVDASLELGPVRKPEGCRRVFTGLAIAVYCAAIFFVLDFGYSTLINSEASPRIAVNQFDHGLTANFDGYVRFGEYRYKFVTNSLGFRDASVRHVPPRSDNYRILLIGDSYTEGMAVSFDDSFAGLLYHAGRQHSPPIEFLNAAVASYSPVIYYRKIKALLESGLRFEEVVVFSDISDIQDEATAYFCLDEDPEYRRFCGSPRPTSTGVTRADEWFQEHFVVTDAARMFIKYHLQLLLGHQRNKSLVESPRAGWTISGYDVGNFYAPLGVQGGIERSKKHMQALADLLTQRGIPLTIVVYPWPLQLASDDRNSRQVAMWREFCASYCKDFIDLFPAFFSEKDSTERWYERLFIYGDLHLSAAGNQFMFAQVAKHLLSNGGAGLHSSR